MAESLHWNTQYIHSMPWTVQTLYLLVTLSAICTLRLSHNLMPPNHNFIRMGQLYYSGLTLNCITLNKYYTLRPFSSAQNSFPSVGNICQGASKFNVFRFWFGWLLFVGWMESELELVQMTSLGSRGQLNRPQLGQASENILKMLAFACKLYSMYLAKNV